MSRNFLACAAPFLVIGTLSGPMAIATPIEAPPARAPAPVADPAPAAPGGTTGVRAAREEDLDFLLKELPERHPNAFASRSREAFMADAEALRARLGELDDVQYMIELSRLIATLGDGHTTVEKSLTRYPIQVAFFDDGPRPLVLPKAHEAALGWKLVAIGDQPMDEVLRRLATVEACETETSAVARARTLIVAPEVLYGLGLAEPQRAVFVLESDDGERRALELEAVDPRTPLEWATRPPGGDLVRMREPRRAAILLPIDDGRSLYLAYRRCAIDPQAPIRDLMKELLERIDRDKPRRVIIDLRGNGGGDSRLLSEWMPELAKRAKEHEPGWLAVLIDRATYSSAIMNAWQLQRGCGAVLYGEPTGGAKNHFGEVRKFTLPNSKLSVQHSTKFFKLDEEGNVPVAPDVRTRGLFANYLAGRDVTLEAALAGGAPAAEETKGGAPADSAPAGATPGGTPPPSGGR